MNNQQPTAFVAFGGNLGNPISTLRKALALLVDRVGDVVAVSALYETRALTLNETPQPNYVNAAVALTTSLRPEDILRELLSVELVLGRDRSHEKRWEPRVIDLDLLFVGDAVVTTEALTLPHPEIVKRDFVLRPLADIAPDFTHPQHGRSIAELLGELLLAGEPSFVLKRVELSAVAEPGEFSIPGIK